MSSPGVKWNDLKFIDVEFSAVDEILLEHNVKGFQIGSLYFLN